MDFLDLKLAIFGDSFVQKFCLIENENSELKFAMKILQLQLNTMRKKSEDLSKEKLSYLSCLKTEFAELIVDHEKVASRLKRIYQILNDL